MEEAFLICAVELSDTSDRFPSKNLMERIDIFIIFLGLPNGDMYCRFLVSRNLCAIEESSLEKVLLCSSFVEIIFG